MSSAPAANAAALTGVSTSRSSSSSSRPTPPAEAHLPFKGQRIDVVLHEGHNNTVLEFIRVLTNRGANYHTLLASDAMPDEPIRDDHAELVRRRALTEDAARPDAIERRHAGNGRTARENIEDLVDAGSFVE